jgi:UDP-2-acetamido-2-deoxy-ribo-hexuluronate aminotransferase
MPMPDCKVKPEITMMALSAEYFQQKAEIDEAIQEVLNSGEFVRGKAVSVFEQNLSDYLQIRHTISCGNGTDALQIALMALEIGRGDEVIIPAFSYAAVAEVICLLGAVPVFGDVEETYYQIDHTKVEELIGPKTKAIIPVHLFGQCANMDAIVTIAERHQLFIIEDNAQALGADYQSKSFGKKSLGGIGHIGCTSFFPTKNLACYGDGGALFTNDQGLAEKIRMIANHGQRKRYQHEVIGVNSRLDTLQAAILNVKLNYLPVSLKRKQEIADYYAQHLKSIEEIVLPQSYSAVTHTWHQFTLRVRNSKRDALQAFLKDQGIQTMVYYAKTLDQQQAYSRFKKHQSPVSELLATEVLSLPIHPNLTEEELLFICRSINNFFYV